LLKAHPRLVLFGETRQELMKLNAPLSASARLTSMLCFSNQFLSAPGRIEQLIKVAPAAMSLQGYQHQLDGLTAFDSRQWVSEIKKPCLLICADEDLLADMADSQFIEKNIKTAEYFCFKNVGHTPMIEHPDIFNQVVLQFLAKY
jgi:pimeloyl-ACP methyl ester carboxylesterase